MRRIGVTAVAACALGLVAGAARGQSGGSGTTQAPAAMPGQVVGTPLNLSPVGTPVNRAVPSRSDLQKVTSPLSRPYDPSKPFDVFKGTTLDPKSVVAPVAGFPGTEAQNPNLLERLYAKLGSSVTSFFSPSPPPRPTYTPGLSRRNKERAMNRTWRRD